MNFFTTGISVGGKTMEQQNASSSKHNRVLAEKIPQEKDYQIYAQCDSEELGRRLVPEILHEFHERGLRLYGCRLPRCDQNLVKNIEALKVREFSPGHTFTANSRQFRIEKVLGIRSYRISDAITRKKYFLKIEPVGLPNQGPSLKRDILVLNNAFESSSVNRRNFLSIFDRGSFPQQYNFVILQLCDCNLADTRSERLNGADFSRSTALHIASQTLQAIHDVQLHHFIHRDIRPGNFVIGLNENHHIVYIVNFSLAYEYVARNIRLEQGKKPLPDETPRVTPKLPWISCRFQSRNFHLCQPVRRLDDVESWIYLIMDVFDQKMLPWKKAKSERVGFEQKERLIMDVEQLGDLKSYLPLMVKHLEHSRVRNTVVDFPFFGSILEQMAKDWTINGKEPLDWVPDSCGYRNKIRGDEVTVSKKSKIKDKTTERKKKPCVPSPELPPADEDFNLLPVIPPEPKDVKPCEKAESKDGKTKKEKKSKEKSNFVKNRNGVSPSVDKAKDQKTSDTVKKTPREDGSEKPKKKKSSNKDNEPSESNS